MVQKTTNQIVNVPLRTKNVIPDLYGLSYPSARPLHIYRKQGTTNALSTAQSFSFDCQPCSTSVMVGVPFKMLGKKDDGTIKIPCCKHITRTATTNISPGYYTTYDAYLKKRGNTFAEKSNFHTIPGVDYTLPPTDQLPDSSCFHENGVVDPLFPACKRTIYKPNNPGFSTEGSVQSSTHTDRVKFNAITKNNASFNKTFQLRFGYNTVPLFFIKNKTALCFNC